MVRSVERIPAVLLLVIACACAGCGRGGPGAAPSPRAGEPPDAPPRDGEIVLTVVYDNNPCREGLETAWGFSCLVEGWGEAVLFDTGGDGELLVRNLARLGIDPGGIGAAVISHAHGDHTGGLSSLLRADPEMDVYLPASAPGGLKDSVREAGAPLVEVSGARRIREGVWSTGELGTEIREQALVVQSDAGLLVVTGCAHPGIVKVVEAAKAACPGEVLLVVGGFHLGSAGRDDIGRIAADLKALGVRNVGPCHCTGAAAAGALRGAFGGGFLEVGVGRRIAAGELE